MNISRRLHQLRMKKMQILNHDIVSNFNSMFYFIQMEKIREEASKRKKEMDMRDKLFRPGGEKKWELEKAEMDCKEAEAKAAAAEEAAHN